MSLKRHHEFMSSYARSLFLNVIERPAFIFLSLFTFTVMAAFTIVIYWIEHETNTNMHGYLDAAYFTVSTMTSVGFGDIVMTTAMGKITAMMMMLLGTLIFVSFAGVVGSTILELDLKIKNKE